MKVLDRWDLPIKIVIIRGLLDYTFSELNIIDFRNHQPNSIANRRSPANPAANTLLCQAWSWRYPATTNDPTHFQLKQTHLQSTIRCTLFRGTLSGLPICESGICFLGFQCLQIDALEPSLVAGLTTESITKQQQHPKYPNQL